MASPPSAPDPVHGTCPDPVFVIGSPRSGTTVLGKSLARHSDLWTSDESAYLYQLFRPKRTSRILRHAREQPSPSWLATEGVDEEEFLAYLGSGINALYTSRSGGKRWVEQTPLNTLMLDQLAAMFPGAKFVHIVRDGRRVVHSMLHFLDKWDEDRRAEMSKHIGAWTVDFGEACRTWAKYVDAALGFAAAQPARCHTVHNEELLQDPDAGFAAIWSFLGLAGEERPALHFSRQRVNSSFKGERVRVAEPWQAWDLEQRRTFVELAGDTMARAGLEIEDGFLAHEGRRGRAASRV